MAEDTRRLANANAGAVGGKTSATTNFNVAQLWHRQVPRGGWSTDLSKQAFESALDNVSRPVKGKYADTLPSSEEFIKDKRREVELENRQP